MTRKDFELVANIIRNMPTETQLDRTVRVNCAIAFNERLAREFPRFDPSKFLDACLDG